MTQEKQMPPTVALVFLLGHYIKGAINLRNLPALIPNQLYWAQSFNVTGMHFSSVFSKSFSTSATVLFLYK